MPAPPLSRTASQHPARRTVLRCRRAAPVLSIASPDAPCQSAPPISWMKCPDAPGTAGPPFGPPSRGGSDMQISSSFVPSALAFALAAASTPAGAQSAQADLYIDVAPQPI